MRHLALLEAAQDVLDAFERCERQTQELRPPARRIAVESSGSRPGTEARGLATAPL